MHKPALLLLNLTLVATVLVLLFALDTARRGYHDDAVSNAKACDAEVAMARAHADDGDDVACYDIAAVLPGTPSNRVGIIVSGTSAEAVLARCAVPR